MVITAKLSSLSSSRVIPDFPFKNPTCGVNPKFDNLINLIGVIPGPVLTPYIGGTFKIDIDLPEAYPFEPTRMIFATKVLAMRKKAPKYQQPKWGYLFGHFEGSKEPSRHFFLHEPYSRPLNLMIHKMLSWHNRKLTIRRPTVVKPMALLDILSETRTHDLHIAKS
ncbi:hypothetical protein R6Q59_028892 [Mikania micrantha]